MTSLAATPIEYRHVVFPDAPEGYGRALNLSPARHPVFPIPLSNEEFTPTEHSCMEWLLELAGLDLADYRLETLKRRIPACLRTLRVESILEVCQAVRAKPELLRTALSALVIGVTSFFRDPAVFTTLQQSILPELTARMSAPRVWSAGCSDGAELYSIAMLLADRDSLRRSCLLGTDCRADAIARGREARYDSTAIRQVPAELVRRYLSFDGRSWGVEPKLASMVDWRVGNILTMREPGTWDLILCRNMAIYLSAQASGRLWSELAQCLRPGGYLVLGKAERPYGATGLMPIAPCVYRRDRS